MTEGVPYYVKFRTPYGIITTLARPELRTVEVTDDCYYAEDHFGNRLSSFCTSRQCDLHVAFHSVASPGTNTLFTLETSNYAID